MEPTPPDPASPTPAHAHRAHDHRAHDHRDDVDRRTRLVLAAVTVPLVLATIAGLVVLWPRGDRSALAEGLDFPDRLVEATVRTVDRAPCSGVEDETGPLCGFVLLALTNGPEEGRRVSLEIPVGPSAPRLRPGDDVVLAQVVDLPPGAPEGAGFYFADFQRRTPMTWLAALFAVAVLALGRWRGLRALLGLGLSLVLLTTFVLPAILEGRSPVAVALVGAAAIAVVALYLSHGLNTTTTTALLGTLASLALTAALAAFFVEATRLTGLGTEEATYLRISASQVNLTGLLLGGVIIGSLGVLDDVTVTQASAVWELRHANPGWRTLEVYRAALRIGRDHIASTVNTLVLAYAGASLPLLLLFTQADRPLGDVLRGEVVAVEVVRTLVGSIGLVASVPLTTALTALTLRGGSRPAPTTG